ALNLNTILYRLYVRAPAQPAYAFAGKFPGTENVKLKDIVGVQFDPSGQLLLGHKLGISIYDAKGKLARTVSSDEPSAFFLDERMRLITVRKDSLIAERGEIMPLRMPMQDKPRAIEDIPSALAMSNGARLIADKKGKQVLRFAPNGTFVGKFVGIEAGRAPLHQLDQVAVIERAREGRASFAVHGEKRA